MVVAAMKHMASNFAKLDKFKEVDFRRWQKKMHFLLFSMSVVYVLTTLNPEDGENATMEQIRKRNNWENHDYVCRGLILNSMSDSLFDIYQNDESSKELWDSLDAKYITEDASSKKFLVSNFINYKMTDSRPVMEQYNELFDFKHTLKHNKEELTLVELGSHMRIEESLRAQDNDKPKGNNVVGPSVINMVEHNNFSGTMTTRDDDVAWWVDSGATVHVCKDRRWFKTYESLNDGSIFHMGNESTALVHGCGCVDLRLGHVHFKRMQDIFKDGLIPAFDMDTKKCKTCMLTKITKKLFQNAKPETEVLELIYSDLCDLHATPSLGNKIYSVTFIDAALRIPTLTISFCLPRKKPDNGRDVKQVHRRRKMRAQEDEGIHLESVVQPSNNVQTPPVPFPKRLRKEKEEAQQKKFLENLKQLHINLPFIEALAQMPKYAKFLKSLLINKAILEESCKITINKRCSAVLLNKLLAKEKDPGSFTIPCDIGHLHIDNTLADLGASISLMPYTMYEKLGLGEPKATRMSLELADRPKSKNAKVRVNTEESAVKPEPELKNTIECNLYPSDGPGKPNSISMKTVKTKWALNQLQQPICVQLTKTVKTLKAQS
ncbi:zinc finger, CCHC-type containing protein [Tanacetum coccineum]